MSQTIDERRHDLLLMPHDQLLALWHKVTGTPDDDTAKKSHVMIREILAREFPESESDQK